MFRHLIRGVKIEIKKQDDTAKVGYDLCIRIGAVLVLFKAIKQF